MKLICVRLGYLLISLGFSKPPLEQNKQVFHLILKPTYFLHVTIVKIVLSDSYYEFEMQIKKFCLLPGWYTEKCFDVKTVSTVYVFSTDGRTIIKIVRIPSKCNGHNTFKIVRCLICNG